MNLEWVTGYNSKVMQRINDAVDTMTDALLKVAELCNMKCKQRGRPNIVKSEGLHRKIQPIWWEAKRNKYIALNEFRQMNDTESYKTYISKRKYFKHLCRDKVNLEKHNCRSKYTDICDILKADRDQEKALSDCNISANEWKENFEMLLIKIHQFAKNSAILLKGISINMMKVANYVLTIAQKFS